VSVSARQYWKAAAVQEIQLAGLLNASVSVGKGKLTKATGTMKQTNVGGLFNPLLLKSLSRSSEGGFCVSLAS
jgi:hypothetical protein